MALSTVYFMCGTYCLGLATATGFFSMLMGKQEHGGGCFFRGLTLILICVAGLFGFSGLAEMPM